MPKQISYDHTPISNPDCALLGKLQIHRLVRKNLNIMIALFIIAVAVFIYMIYVLIKPEKF
ncbi:potassium-transporting ATPase subunit F [Pedobacter aquatilis]|uniref:potassium-transporting ATPase subunit F n=1 Tax=Pedobacter aquatilis TaxID=351343 RepID=UPI00338F1085